MRHLIAVLESNGAVTTRVVSVQLPEGVQRTILLSSISGDKHEAVLKMYSIARGRSKDLFHEDDQIEEYTDDL